ncbi:hypothetical protein HGM15179_018036, partial [Zosterops borbonicus]
RGWERVGSTGRGLGWTGRDWGDWEYWEGLGEELGAPGGTGGALGETGRDWERGYGYLERLGNTGRNWEGLGWTGRGVGGHWERLGGTGKG